MMANYVLLPTLLDDDIITLDYVKQAIENQQADYDSAFATGTMPITASGNSIIWVVAEYDNNGVITSITWDSLEMLAGGFLAHGIPQGETSQQLAVAQIPPTVTVAGREVPNVGIFKRTDRSFITNYPFIVTVQRDDEEYLFNRVYIGYLFVGTGLPTISYNGVPDPITRVQGNPPSASTKTSQPGGD